MSSTRFGRGSPLVRQQPPPLPVPPGRCKFTELIFLVGASRARRRDLPLCDRPASRRVQVGMSTSADLCLWHSLVARERLSAHLVRDLSASP